MKKKVGIIASAVATIGVCASIIAGSTYALFTDSSSVDITVKSAKVNVESNVKDLKQYTAVSEAEFDGDVAGAKTTVDEFGSTYYYAEVAEGKEFAEYNEATKEVKLLNVAAGSLVTFTIEVDGSASTIPVLYRTSVSAKGDVKLLTALEYTVGGREMKYVKSYKSSWGDLAEGDSETVEVTMEIPMSNQSANGGYEADIVYAVEAIQGNAAVSGGEEIAYLYKDVFDDLAANGGTVTFDSDISLTAEDFDGDLHFTKNAEIDLGGNALDIATAGEKIYIENGANVTLKNGNIAGVVKTANLSNMTPLFNIEAGSVLNLDGVTVDVSEATDGAWGCTVLATVLGKDATLNVANSSFKTSAGYAISTNAGDAANYGVNVNVTDTSVESANTPFLFNVTGNYNLENVTATSCFQTVILRSGTAVLKDCDFKNVIGTGNKELYKYFDNRNWGSGNLVELATVTVGNKLNKDGTTGGYAGDANLTLINTKLYSRCEAEGYSEKFAALAIAGNSQQATSVVYDEKTVIEGGKVKLIGENYTVNNVKADRYIFNVNDLLAFANEVNGEADVVDGNNFAGKTVALMADIDLENMEWNPIGEFYTSDSPASGCDPFHGTFDGNGHTIFNLNVNNDKHAGLFGYSSSSDTLIKNLKLDGVKASGDDRIGSVFARMYKGNVDNCEVKNATLSGNHYIGGVVGQTYGSVNNCLVENITITATPIVKETEADGYDNGDKVGGVLGQGWSDYFTGNTAKNVTITAWRDLGGIAGYIGKDGIVPVFSGNTVENITLNYYAKDGMTTVGGKVNQYMGKALGNNGNNALVFENNVEIVDGKEVVFDTYYDNLILADGRISIDRGGKYINYSDIDSAFNALQNNDVLLIGAGTYTTNGNRAFAVEQNNVKIYGAGAATVLDCGTTEVSGQAGLYIIGNNVTLANLTVKSAGYYLKDGSQVKIAAIKVSADITSAELLQVAGVTIKNVTVDAGVGTGLNLHAVDNAVVDGLNVVNFAQCGISMARANVTVSNTTIKTVEKKWGDIGIMYGANTQGYETASTLTLGEGNDFQNGVIYSERPEAATLDTVEGYGDDWKYNQSEGGWLLIKA